VTIYKKPIARVREIDTYKATKERDKDGHPIMAHTGKATVRTAYCEEHKRETTQFNGVNENGWIFYCRGGEDGISHNLMADPAK
jgi:hypothetical protein